MRQAEVAENTDAAEQAVLHRFRNSYRSYVNSYSLWLYSVEGPAWLFLLARSPLASAL